MRANTSHSHRRRVPEIGRSIEEVILTRKLSEAKTSSISSPLFDQSQLKSTLPLHSQSVQARPPSGSFQALTTYEGPMRDPEAFSGEDVKAMMDTLVHYCQALQVRVKELEEELTQQKISNQYLPPHTTLAISSSTSSFFKDQLNQHGLAPRRFSTKQLSHESSPALDISHTAEHFISSQNNPEEDLQVIRSLANSSKIMTNIDKKLTNLSHIFSKNDPIARRISAITTLQKNIRRFIVRCRYLSFKGSLRNWKLIRTSPVIWLIETINNIKNKKFYLIKNFIIKKKLNFMLVIFKKWKNIYINNKPWRVIIRKNVNQRIETKRLNILSLFFFSFKQIVEKKKLNYIKINEKKNLIEAIRNSLIKKNKLKISINAAGSSLIDNKEKQHQDLSMNDSNNILSSSTNELITTNVIVNAIITDDVIKKVYYNEVIVKHDIKVNQRLLSKFFNILKNYLIEVQNMNLQKAKKFYFNKFVGKTFFRWSDYTYFSNRELINTNRWLGPRNYIIRYNQKRVDYFSRVRLERKVFNYWTKFTKLSSQVNLKYRIKLTKFLYINFMAWRNISKKFHNLRKVVYDNWKNYSKIILRDPFNNWIEYMRASKTRFYEHSRIATAYRRWKWRQKLIKIIKVWRHQSLFGRTDGLYSRQMLLKSLSESKHFIHNLEKLLNEQTLNLDECRAIIQNEFNNKNALQENILENNLEIESLKLQNHNIKQELLRMNAMVDALKLINPKQFSHLDKLQFSNFQFKERFINYDEIEAEVKPNGEQNSFPIKIPDLQLGEVTESSSNTLISVRDPPTSSTVSLDVSKSIETTRSISNVSFNSSGAITPLIKDQEPVTAQDPQLVQTSDLNLQNEENIYLEKKDFTESFEYAKSLLTLDDLKILERTKWIVTRYQEAMDQIIQQDEEKEEKEKEKSTSPEETQMIQNASNMFKPQNNSQLILSPLTGSPIRSRSRSNSAVDNTSPMKRNSSLTRNSGGLLRRSMSMDETNSPLQTTQNLAIEGLEDTVISWAKMLESFLEFITYGEVSLFPNSDKRHWARFLLNQSSVPLNEVPPEVLTSSGQVDSSLSRSSLNNVNPNDPPDIMKEIQKAIVTVDELMHGGKSWKDALMNLRVMFPGPGNFTGHTIKDESDMDTNLFRRFLKMSKDIKAMEDQQSLRYNKPNMEDQRGITFLDNFSNLRRGRLMSDTSKLYSSSDESNFEDKREPGINIYSSNLANTLKKSIQEDDPVLQSTIPVTYVPLRISRQQDPAETRPPPLSVSSSGASLYKTIGLDDEKRKREEEEALLSQEKELNNLTVSSHNQEV